jgi:hypothetical protein
MAQNEVSVSRSIGRSYARETTYQRSSLMNRIFISKADLIADHFLKISYFCNLNRSHTAGI